MQEWILKRCNYVKKETIFISHATPDDNEFTIWLASRLQMLGYKVWVDKKALLGGEKIWEEIDNVIRNEACKYLLVYSKNICDQKPGKLKSGISKELHLAESVASENGFKDFRILLKIDNSAFNLFIGANELTHIPFNENWAGGLNQLIKKFDKDGIKPDEDNQDQGFGEWYESKYITQNGIIPKKELYYTNWWPITNLPESFYIFQFQTEQQAKLIYEQEQKYPVGKITNHLCSFAPNISTEIKQDEQILNIKPLNQFEIKVDDVLLGFERLEFPAQRDAENHFKQLLKRIFHLIMKKRGMFWYEMANRKLAYFYTPANLRGLKVKYEYPLRGSKRKKKTKNLIGAYKNIWKWHYAVSIKPILFPIIGYSLKNHLTFSDDGLKIWEDKNKIHSHRRSKGKTFYNEEWRDMFFAFLNGLCNSEGRIEIELKKDFILYMCPWTELYWADFGYYEPKDKNRQGLLSDYIEDETEMDEAEEIPE